jgi:hypothetical protein
MPRNLLADPPVSLASRYCNLNARGPPDASHSPCTIRPRRARPPKPARQHAPSTERRPRTSVAPSPSGWVTHEPIPRRTATAKLPLHPRQCGAMPSARRHRAYDSRDPEARRVAYATADGRYARMLTARRPNAGIRLASAMRGRPESQMVRATVPRPREVEISNCTSTHPQHEEREGGFR